MFLCSYYVLGGGSEDGEVAEGDAVPVDGEPAEGAANAVVEGSEGAEPVEERSFVLNCNADTTNRFYGNLGALRCLHEEGDVAILELQYLQRKQPPQLIVTLSLSNVFS